MPQPSKRPNRRVTAVIFDLDDTLIDWSTQTLHGAEIGRRHLRKVYQYLVMQGFEAPEEEIFYETFGEVLLQMWSQAKETWAGVAISDVMQQALIESGLNSEQIDLDEVLRVYDWQPVSGVKPFADTIPVLRTLQQQGYKIGLITNSMQPMWMRDVELEVYGIIGYLDARITSGDTGYMKPHPAIYQRILHLLETEAEQAVFVGDRPSNDIAGANEAGLISVLMRPSHLDYDLNGVQPDYTITRLNELLPILAQLT